VAPPLAADCRLGVIIGQTGTGGGRNRVGSTDQGVDRPTETPSPAEWGTTPALALRDRDDERPVRRC